MTNDDWLEIEEIKQLKYRYIRSLDLKDWAEFADCLTDNCRWSSSGGTIQFTDRKSIVEWVVAAVGAKNRLSSHTVAQPQIERTSEMSATGIWKLESLVILSDEDLTIRGAGFYHDEYVKEAGRWKIRLTGHDLIYEEAHPRLALGIHLTASHWATGGVQELSSTAAGLPPARS